MAGRSVHPAALTLLDAWTSPPNVLSGEDIVILYNDPTPPNCVAANPAIALWLQSKRLVGRVVSAKTDMHDKVEEEYAQVWRKICTAWLGWSKERFERFLSCWNARLCAEGGYIWFGQGRPFQYVIPLLLTDQFEEFLHHKVRKPKYGSPEWIYFESELLATFERGVGCRAPNSSKKFDWTAARKRVEEHLALYRQRIPLPDTVTNYEKFIHTFDPTFPP